MLAAAHGILAVTTSTEAAIMTGPSTTADQHLALTSVVASGLPASLGTDAAERFYDVPAVFNRRPNPEEIAALEGSGSHHLLQRAGYPDVTLAVHDRRLIIGNTNLDQLERGLSTAIANLVHQISSNALATIRSHELTRRPRKMHNLLAPKTPPAQPNASTSPPTRLTRLAAARRTSSQSRSGNPVSKPPRQ